MENFDDESQTQQLQINKSYLPYKRRSQLARRGDISSNFPISGVGEHSDTASMRRGGRRREGRVSCWRVVHRQKPEMEVRPKWEDLNMDCLVNIFSRLDMENLLLDVPYVCKSWYKATCNPQCWTTLNFMKILADEQDCYDSNFPERITDEYKLYIDESPANEMGKYRPYLDSAVTKFIKYVVKRSNGLATFVKLPSCCTEEALIFISNECPNLKILKLPIYMEHSLTSLLPSLVSKWKRLENLRVTLEFNTGEIFAQISKNCNSFSALEISNGHIGKEEASALVSFLPDLKVLSLRSAHISKENLLMILKSCKKLEYLDARDCVGFDEDDDEMLKTAAHIPWVKLEGSTLYEIDDDDCSDGGEDYSDYHADYYNDPYSDYDDYCDPYNPEYYPQI